MSRRAIFGALAVAVASVVVVFLATIAMLDVAEPHAEASTGVHSAGFPSIEDSPVWDLDIDGTWSCIGDDRVCDGAQPPESIAYRWNLISYPWWVRVWEGT